jgi:tRNA-Thr(GGU) m(6)t(6)A37 methyltransferase TsaA
MRCDRLGDAQFSVDLNALKPLAGRLIPTLTVRPIGFITTAQPLKFHAPHQPAEDGEARSVLELLPDCGYERALQDLAGFDRVWLVWWFHRNPNWRPLVLPPRGPAQRRGVFATRSPHRPNPLGLTPVRLLAVEGRRLILGPCDLVDGTPVLDIKPYVPAYDSFPTANAGWIDALDTELEQPARFTVNLSAHAKAQSRWLLEPWGIDFIPRMTELLARDPTPHRTRRIKRRRGSLHEIGCGAWRALFQVEASVVNVLALEPAYPLRFLTRDGYEDVPDREAQLAFMKHWPTSAPPESSV